MFLLYVQVLLLRAVMHASRCQRDHGPPSSEVTYHLLPDYPVHLLLHVLPPVVLLLQVSRQGVFDVGLVAPSHLQAFFRSCSFELDREQSVPMAINSSWWKDADSINAGLQANPALQKLLLTAMDDEQRRLFTRCG
jgi:hypothetical protein